MEYSTNTMYVSVRTNCNIRVCIHNTQYTYRHRHTKPAIVYSDGSKYFMIINHYHNLNGPAIIGPAYSGHWVYGKVMPLKTRVYKLHVLI